MPVTKLDHQKAFELYKQGLNDVEIAEKHGNINRRTVNSWRHRNNLPCNANRYSSLTDAIHNELLEAYHQKWSDCKIAKKFNCSNVTIKDWRDRNNLLPNYISPKRRQKIEEINFREIKDEEKPWHDPESLFCCDEFLEELTGKKIKKMKGE